MLFIGPANESGHRVLLPIGRALQLAIVYSEKMGTAGQYDVSFFLIRSARLRRTGWPDKMPL